MQRSIKREKIVEFVKHGVDTYLTRNIDQLGYSHVIDVNMSEDLKTAYIYISCPQDKNEKSMENSIIRDRQKIFEIFKESFSSKFMPKIKIICLRETDVKF